MKKHIVIWILLLLSGCTERHEVQVEMEHYRALIQNISENRDVFRDQLLVESSKPNVEIIAAYASSTLLWLSTQYDNNPHVMISKDEMCRAKSDLVKIGQRYSHFIESYTPDERFIVSRALENIGALLDGLGVNCSNLSDRQDPGKVFESYHLRRANESRSNGEQ